MKKFLEKYIAGVTVDDRLEQYHLKEQQKNARLKAKGIIVSKERSPGLRPTRSIKLQAKLLAERQRVDSKPRFATVKRPTKKRSSVFRKHESEQPSTLFDLTTAAGDNQQSHALTKNTSRVFLNQSAIDAHLPLLSHIESI